MGHNEYESATLAPSRVFFLQTRKLYRWLFITGFEVHTRRTKADILDHRKSDATRKNFVPDDTLYGLVFSFDTLALTACKNNYTAFHIGAKKKNAKSETR